MRALFLAAILTVFSGCATLNSPPTTPHSCSEQKKCCGCPGMQQCNTNPDKGPCCTPDDCKCKQID